MNSNNILSPILNPVTTYPKGTEPQHIVIDKPSSATVIYASRSKLKGTNTFQNPFSFKVDISKIRGEVRSVSPCGYRGFIQVNNINKFNNVISVELPGFIVISLTMAPYCYSPEQFLRYLSSQLTQLCTISGYPYEFEYTYSALDDYGTLSCKDIPFTSYKNYRILPGTSFYINYDRMMRIDAPSISASTKGFWDMNMMWTRNLNIICAQLTKDSRISAIGTSDQDVFLSIPWPEPWIKDKIITPATDLTNNHYMTFTTTTKASTVAFLITDDEGVDISQYSPSGNQFFSDIYVTISV